jgi:hypothetical protein
MSEQLANLYSSTLSANYVAGSGSMHVVNAAGAPITGTFSCSIIDQSTGLVKLIVTVTAVAGAVFFVTAETADVNCSLGDGIAGTMLTVRSIQAVLQDWLGFGTQASLPLSTGRPLGQRFKASNSPVEYMMNGSSVWVPCILGIPGLVPPVAANFSTFNAAGTGITFVQVTTGNYITIHSLGSSTTGQICGITKALLAATFTAIFNFSALGGALNQDVQFGICVSDGTKFIVMAFQWFGNALFLNISKYTNATTFSADYFATQTPMVNTPLLCFVVQETVAHRNWYVSPDGGRTLCLVFQTSNTDFLTTTSYGVFLRGDAAANDQALTLWALNESNP